ncbi:MAG: hypothetical protein KGJ30_01810 [Burkholderiales bacterium]|nr:hypothetical protein [Burkholderiales bacterium]MDE1925867.1 hypothetical protein [Burkholderiales bacterium]MDE2157631.1 hypothetical protein [Burkholderiales bacterium]
MKAMVFSVRALLPALLVGLAGCAIDTGSSGAASGGVHLLGRRDAPMASMFPSDRYTVVDSDQLTGLRVDLPYPDCKTHPDDCADIGLLNRLDGFSLDPTSRIPFDGDIDPRTATSANVFYVELQDLVSGAKTLRRIGIDRAIWNPQRKILSVKPVEHLREHTRYALVVTSGLAGARGGPVSSPDFQAEVKGAGRDGRPGELSSALADIQAASANVVAVSVFTTMSATADLVKIRAQMLNSAPPRADFDIAEVVGSRRRAVFDVAALTAVDEVRQSTIAPAFSTEPVDLRQMSLVPGSTARVAFGRYASPNYLTPDRVIPDLPSRTGTPVVRGEHEVTFVLFLPAGPMPARGWPVVIFGHGYSDSNVQAGWGFSSVLPSMGVAVVGINAVGHGGGPLTHIDLRLRDGTLASIPGNGRSVAMKGLLGTPEGSFARYGGLNAVGRDSLIDLRDGVRQTVVDLMQLTRMIAAGVDVDGSGRNTLDPDRIFYAGASLGGVYGTVFTAMEPRIRAAEFFVTGGPWPDLVRMGGIHQRPAQGYGLMFAARTPALNNLPGVSPSAYDENMPGKYAAVLTDTVAGAFDLQQWFDRNEWIGEKANPLVYAPLISARPLQGKARPIALLIAKGDKTVNNEVSNALSIAGGWRAHTGMFRFDLLRAAHPELPPDPHRWQTGAVKGLQDAQITCQRQAGDFLLSDGAKFGVPPAEASLFEFPAKHLPFDGLAR